MERPGPVVFGQQGGDPRPFVFPQPAELEWFTSDYVYSQLWAWCTGRLITIEPGSEPEPLKLVMMQSDFNKIEYEAVSWHEKREEAKAWCEVRENGQGRLLKIEYEVQESLLALRLPDKPRLIWHPSICVNWDDHDEVVTMTANTATIFGSASRVLAWLHLRHPLGLVRLVQRCPTVAVLKWVLLHQWPRSCMIEFCTHSWFTFRWSITHFALAKKASIVTPSGEVDWVVARPFLSMVSGFCRKLFDEAPGLNEELGIDPRRLANTLGDCSSYHFVNILDKIRPEGGPQGFVPRFEMEELLTICITLDFDLTHDHLYSLLALATDGASQAPQAAPGALSIPINYRQDLIEMYRDFVRLSIHRSRGRIDVVLRSWARESIYDRSIPWLAARRSHCFTHDRRVIDQRVLAGTAQQALYSASGPLPERVTIPGFLGRHGIILKGFVVDTVGTFAAQHDWVITKVWMDFAGWKDPKRLPPAHFWQTLIAARDNEGRQATERYQQLCQRAFVKRSEMVLVPVNIDRIHRDIHDVLHTESGMEQPLAQRWENFHFSMRHTAEQVAAIRELRRVCAQGYMDVNAFVAHKCPVSEQDIRYLCRTLARIDFARIREEEEYCKMVWRTVMGRLLFRSGFLGLYGLVPAIAREGDLICILRGCSVPVILRHDGERGHYSMIGEAYVHGLMDGQAMDLRYDMRNFPIVS